MNARAMLYLLSLRNGSVMASPVSVPRDQGVSRFIRLSQLMLRRQLLHINMQDMTVVCKPNILLQHGHCWRRRLTPSRQLAMNVTKRPDTGVRRPSQETAAP